MTYLLKKKPNMDDYMEVMNGEDTYDAVADVINKTGSCVVGWTDQLGSHFDILFTKRPVQIGNLRRGCKGEIDLFVSVNGVGAHCFEINDERTHHGYISEKFAGFFGGETGIRFAELLNNIKRRI